ncbi:MadS family sensor histidine kinase [Tomitella fengzijianii]|uniref:Sensor histidine kinase n=1 Tax=Tomitella fengzijianii TaxID=2597660 RepID=A0A516X1G3_9ACTN|nr:GAF domain-containing sensor histidine kinase [Tomitella fengzijianii]QDQ96924.1 sensor histidine kinase [Tomitella fengzijianii]
MTRRGGSDLERLTGVRSGKSTFYREYRGAAERLERVVHALDTISRALVRTVEGPEALVLAVAEAVRLHLEAQWVLFALADGELPEAEPRHLVVDAQGHPYAYEGLRGGDPPPEDMPAVVINRLNDILRGEFDFLARPVVDPHHAHVPIDLGGGVVGAFAAWTPPRRRLDATDESVMRILAGQTAVALQNSALFQSRQVLLERAESSYAAASAQADQLAARNAELVETQWRLGLATRRKIVDDERHRIARELHDSVTQCVLSAGMQIEVCRSGIPDAERGERLDLAKTLTRSAVEQLRSAIYALDHKGESERSGLAEMLRQLCTVHMPSDLRVQLRMTGAAADLPRDVEHALLRIAGEALFNASMHGGATRAIVRVDQRADGVTLAVSDDGTGDPAALRLRLRIAQAGDLDVHHRGLANMQARAQELGGTLAVRRARIGGVRVAVAIPLPVREDADPGAAEPPAPGPGRSADPARGERGPA